MTVKDQAGSRRRPAAGFYVAATILVVIAAGVGKVWWALTDHGAKAVWTRQATTAMLETSAHGGWLTAGVVVRPDDMRLVGYDRRDGRQRWTLSGAAASDLVCGVSPELRDGVGIVLFGHLQGHYFNSCDEVVAVVADTGAVRWRATARAWMDRQIPPGDFAPAMADSTVAVLQPNGIDALHRGDGTPGWTYEPPAGCGVDAVRGTSDHFLAAIRCADGTGQAVALDAVTGSELWHGSLSTAQARGEPPMDMSTFTIISADPPVIAHYQSGTAFGSITSFDPTGHTLTTIPTADLALNEQSNIEATTEVQVSGSLLIAVSQDHTDSPMSEPSVEIQAFDLGNGSRRWSVSPTSGGEYELVWEPGTADVTVVESDSHLIGAGHVRLLRLTPKDGNTKVMGTYSPSVLSDLSNPLYLGDGSEVFGISAVEENPAMTSSDGTPLPGKATQTAVVRIR